MEDSPTGTQSLPVAPTQHSLNQTSPPPWLICFGFLSYFHRYLIAINKSHKHYIPLHHSPFFFLTQPFYQVKSPPLPNPPDLTDWPELTPTNVSFCLSLNYLPPPQPHLIAITPTEIHFHTESSSTNRNRTWEGTTPDVSNKTQWVTFSPTLSLQNSMTGF